MSEREAKSGKSLSAFWWACSYLRPHRGSIIISVACALLVGFAMAGGLATMLPIIRVLFNGDTVQSWLNRQIVEHRMGVKLAETAEQFTIVGVTRGDKQPLPAEKAGLRPGTVGPLSIPGTDALLATLADPSHVTASLAVGESSPVTVQLKPVPWYVADAQQIGERCGADERHLGARRGGGVDEVDGDAIGGKVRVEPVGRQHLDGEHAVVVDHHHGQAHPAPARRG